MSSYGGLYSFIYLPIESCDHLVNAIWMNEVEFKAYTSIKIQKPINTWSPRVHRNGAVAFLWGANIIINNSLPDYHYEVEDESNNISWICGNERPLFR